MLRDLHSSGFVVYSFESRQAKISRRMNGWFDRFLGGAVAAFCRRGASWGKWLQKMIKAAWLMAHPPEWYFFLQRGMGYNECAARDLRQLLRDWQRHYPSRRVYLFAHSAGGIVSSWLDHEPNVVSLVCFGYPFRHPQRRDEYFRTAHLQGVCKPFLIIQGDRDDYGTAERAKQYALSGKISVVSIKADHNYDDFAPEVYKYCLELVGDHYDDHL